MKIPFSALKEKDEQLKEMLLGKYGSDVKEYQIMKECKWKQEKISIL